MDLSSLLNQGDSGLSIDDLYSLQRCDNNEKLNKLNGVVFDYPSNSTDTYRFFDAFIQLVLSIQDDGDEFGTQYANTLIIGALRTCINGLLQQEGFHWLVSYPSHLSDRTWNLLESRSDTTFLNYLYGLALGLNKQDSIPFDTWVQSLLYFLRAKVPALTCHMWLNFAYLDDRHRLSRQRQPSAQAAFLVAMEAGFSNTLYDLLLTMTGPDNLSLLSKLESGLGGTLLRDPCTYADIMLAMGSLEHSIRTCRTNYPLLAHESSRYITDQISAGLDRKPQKLMEEGQTKRDYMVGRYPTLVTKDLLGDQPLDPDSRSRLFEQAKKRWIQATGVLRPDDFDQFLQQLVVTLYPSKKRCILDSVLVDWAARDPFGRHMQLIVDTIMRLINSFNYNKKWAPYTPWIEAFDLTGNGRTTPAGYNIKTGAEINLSKFSTKHNAAIVKGLGNLLQQMTLRATSTTAESWIVDCLLVSSPDVIQTYFDYLVHQVNQEFQADRLHEHNIMTFASHLHGILARQEIYPIAPFVVPSLLRRASEHTLAWIIQRKTDRVGYVKTDRGSQRYHSGQSVVIYFDEGTDLSSKHLVTDLLRNKTKNYMNYLLTYLHQRSKLGDPSQQGTQSWFSRHFMEAILTEAATTNDGQQHSVASELYDELLRDHSTFKWVFTVPYVATDAIHMGVQLKKTNLVKNHTFMPIRDTGMATLLHCVTRLGEPQQHRLTQIWMDLWISSSAAVDDDNGNGDRLCVPDLMVLQCIGLYDQAPVIMRQMMERFMKLGIQARTDISINDNGSAPHATFNERIMDLLMLSDAPEVDGLLDLYLQLSYTSAATSDADQDEMVQAVVDTLIELAGESDIFFKYPVYLKASGRHPAAPPKHEPTPPLDEFDEYTRMAETGSASKENHSTDEWSDSGGTINTPISAKSRRLRQTLSQKQRKKQASLAKTLIVQKMDEIQLQHDSKKRRRKTNGQDDQHGKKRQKLDPSKSDAVAISTKEENDRNAWYEVLVTLLQRLVNFILVVVSDSDENSLCPMARKSLRSKMVRHFLLYEPLATLTRLSDLPTNILNDIQVIIDISIDSLEKDGDTVTPGIIQRILNPL